MLDLKWNCPKLYRLPSGVRHMTCYLPGTSSGGDFDSMRLLRRTDFSVGFKVWAESFRD
jgi:hypothetical protein